MFKFLSRLDNYVIWRMRIDKSVIWWMRLEKTMLWWMRFDYHTFVTIAYFFIEPSVSKFDKVVK